jgi:zinc carboxypeptidase
LRESPDVLTAIWNRFAIRKIRPSSFGLSPAHKAFAEKIFPPIFTFENRNDILWHAKNNKMGAGTGALVSFAWVFSCAAQVAYTTNPAANVPTPESVLGHKPGDDFYLANYDESREYFHKLAASSNRVKLITVGKTTRGLDWEIAIISSPENLQSLDRYKDISRKLADGRGVSAAEAHELARQGKAIVHIDGGLHSSEVAGAQQSINLAYKLVSSQNDPEVDAILNNVILMLWPTLNPDGQNEVVGWYRKNLGTTFEVSPLPDLYQEYVGHDNNRDGYMNNMLESQDVTRTELEWGPVIFYCHHQTAPFPTRIFIPPFVEPISSNIHPLMGRWLNVLGTDIAAYLDEHGMPGAVNRVGFDNWYPGFLDFTHIFRNSISLFHGDGSVPLRDAALLSGG